MSFENHHRSERQLARHEEPQHHLSREAQTHLAFAHQSGRHPESAHKHLPSLSIVENHPNKGGDKSEYENMTPAQKRDLNKQWKINEAHGED